MYNPNKPPRPTEDAVDIDLSEQGPTALDIDLSEPVPSEVGFDPESTQTLTMNGEATGENVVVEEAFSKFKEGLEGSTEISADAVANERTRQEQIKAQREQDQRELAALRAKLNMDSEDTIPA